MGRIVRFEKRQLLTQVLDKLLIYLGTPKAVSLAIPQMSAIEDIDIGSIGICAGSGSSLLNGLDVDMLLTGELDHHSTLAATESGKCVLCLNHSNSERGYLRAVLKEKLTEALKIEMTYTVEETDPGYESPPIEFDEEVVVEVSETDRDPFEAYVRRF